MAWKVGVRNYAPLEAALKSGSALPLPEECLPNQRVFEALLSHVPQLDPAFSALSLEEVARIAGGIAYLVRTDELLRGSVTLMGPSPFAGPVGVYSGNLAFFEKRSYKLSDGSSIDLHLANDPNVLQPGWKFPFDSGQGSRGQAFEARASELFRCCGGIQSWIPGFTDRLDPEHHSLAPAFHMSDVMGYLLHPMDLTDYAYTPTEIKSFHETLARQAREV